MPSICRKEEFSSNAQPILVPKSYEDTPLADQKYAQYQFRTDLQRDQAEEGICQSWHPRGQSAASFRREWTHFDSENLVSDSLHDPLKFSSRGCWFSPLRERISEALLLEVLVEVFGPQGLSKEGVDGYKGNWIYRLVHESGDAELEFYDSKGLPRTSFSGSEVHIGSAIQTINFLIKRPICTAMYEQDFRQDLGECFMLRQVDIDILENYNQLWRHHNMSAAEKRQQSISAAWVVEEGYRRPNTDAYLLIWSSVNERLAYRPLEKGPPAFKDDFNTRISTHLLLQRLMLTFDAQFWKEGSIVWGITLRHSISDSWLQIWNQAGYLLIVYEGMETVRKIATDMVSYLISADVITRYDGLIAGRVA